LKALKTGIKWQDGLYLAKFLLNKSYDVYGTYRRLSTSNFWYLQYPGIFDRIKLIPADLVNSNSMSEAIEITEPDEKYHLAAYSFPGASFDQPIGTGDITGLGSKANRTLGWEPKFKFNDWLDSWLQRILIEWDDGKMVNVFRGMQRISK